MCCVLQHMECWLDQANQTHTEPPTEAAFSFPQPGQAGLFHVRPRAITQQPLGGYQMSIHTQRLTQRFMAAEDEGSTGGGAPAADDPPTITADMQALIDAEVNKVTNGLKNKNTELIGTIRTVKDDLKRFDGIDPDAVRTILQRFSDDEEGKLLAAGKVDEVLTKRTDRLRADYEKKLQAESEGRTTAEAKAAKLADKSLAGALRDSAIKAGARPTALEDIVLRSRGTWVLGDNGEVGS